MNQFLNDSIELANNSDYLDRLYSVYPIANNIRRNIPENVLSSLENSFNEQNNEELIRQSLDLDLFPIKDSYVAFLKRCPDAIDRNPRTVNRLAGSIYELGWEGFIRNVTEPKESNRQMGNKFSGWLDKNPLGILPVPIDEFTSDDNDAVLRASDTACKNFACEKFGYRRNKGLDFIARFNKKYIIGEAKFLTDFGGHQNAQFEDAISTLNSEVIGATVIAILDGVLFIKGNNKMFHSLCGEYNNRLIMSALLLNTFCYSL